jgi:hypothetical protein
MVRNGRRGLALVAAGASLVLTATACGGGDSGSGDGKKNAEPSGNQGGTLNSVA